MYDSYDEEIKNLHWLRGEVTRWSQYEFPVQSVLKVIICANVPPVTTEEEVMRQKDDAYAKAWNAYSYLPKRFRDPFYSSSQCDDRSEEAEEARCTTSAMISSRSEFERAEKNYKAALSERIDAERAVRQKVALQLHSRLQAECDTVKFYCINFEETPPAYYLFRCGSEEFDHVHSFFAKYNAELAVHKGAPQVLYSIIVRPDLL